MAAQRSGQLPSIRSFAVCLGGLPGSDTVMLHGKETAVTRNIAFVRRLLRLEEGHRVRCAVYQPKRSIRALCINSRVESLFGWILLAETIKWLYDITSIALGHSKSCRANTKRAIPRKCLDWCKTGTLPVF